LEVGTEHGGQKVELLVELLGGALAGASGTPGFAGDDGEALFAGRLEIAPATEKDGDADQRKLRVLLGVDGGAVGQLEAKGVGVGHVELEVGKFQLFRPVRDLSRVRGRCGE